MILRFRRARRWHSSDINITAFMNLMVALVPFLLITLVFTQMAVQELNTPENAPAQPDEAPPQLITVTVRAQQLIVGDMGGTIRVLPSTPAGYDLKALGELLRDIKAQMPTEEKLALLLEPDISYDNLIQVMDAARYFPGEAPPRDMFPQISIGDAPVMAGAAP
jgi:biopolymer transport protein ExbD